VSWLLGLCDFVNRVQYLKAAARCRSLDGRTLGQELLAIKKNGKASEKGVTSTQSAIPGAASVAEGLSRWVRQCLTSYRFRASLSSHRARRSACLGGSVGGTDSRDGVTELLVRWNDGDLAARDALIPLVYDELRRVAKKNLAGQRSDHTLQATALVHEAYLRLVNRKAANWQGRVHFFALAAQMMRQILVDHARMRNAAKRGGGASTLLFEDAAAAGEGVNLDLIGLDKAMKRLASLDARQSQIVELRFFGGLSIEEAARVVDVSPATAKREWATARVWLHHAMESDAGA
jgi:RNA polymerase sigma factor (TIGR02999 family)